MRIRTIKPEFFADEDLATLPHFARLLFVGLLCCADVAGRIEDRPKRIRALVFPYEPAAPVDEALDQLTVAGFLLRYEADGVKVIQIRTFTKHQRISGTEAKAESKLPAPNVAPTSQWKQLGSNEETPWKQLGSLEREREREREKEKEQGKGEGANPPPSRYACAFETIGVLDPREHRLRIEAALHLKSAACSQEWDAMEDEVKAEWIAAAFEVANTRRPGGCKVHSLVAGILYNAIQEGTAPAVYRKPEPAAPAGTTEAPPEVVAQRSEPYERARATYVAKRVDREYPGNSNAPAIVAKRLREGTWDHDFHKAIRNHAAELAAKLMAADGDPRAGGYYRPQYPFAALVDDLTNEEGR